MRTRATLTSGVRRASRWNRPFAARCVNAASHFRLGLEWRVRYETRNPSPPWPAGRAVGRISDWWRGDRLRRGRGGRRPRLPHAADRALRFRQGNLQPQHQAGAWRGPLSRADEPDAGSRRFARARPHAAQRASSGPRSLVRRPGLQSIFLFLTMAWASKSTSGFRASYRSATRACFHARPRSKSCPGSRAPACAAGFFTTTASLTTPAMPSRCCAPSRISAARQLTMLKPPD